MIWSESPAPPPAAQASPDVVLESTERTYPAVEATGKRIAVSAALATIKSPLASRIVT